LTCSLNISVHVSGHGHWSYDSPTGPDHWGGVCKTGLRQSPIDIQAADLDFEPMPRIHFVNYAHRGPIKVENNGHTVMVSGFDKWGDKRPYIYGGGLDAEYELEQYHFHWAQNDSGSEHTLATLHYPVEIHLVHKKRGLVEGDKLGVDGIAVVGIFGALGNNPGPLADIEQSLRAVTTNGKSTSQDGYQPMPILPDDLETFYRYDGSLTTPGCDEAVVWTIMSKYVSITPQQLNLLRQVRFASGRIGENVRPTQPLNGRRIKFRPSNYSFQYNVASSIFAPSFYYMLSQLF
uniref:Carbonic anhydrase n=1 Tax=Anisakis simplex TaxID=6269 RepID=A0A0M3K058_ANISI